MKKIELLKFTIKYLAENNIPLTKINLQKIVFYLCEVGIPIKYRFEPYLYGPYSSELKSDLWDMEIWDEIKLQSDRAQYEVIADLKPAVSHEMQRKISTKIDQFADVVNNNFSFDAMEVSGTVIYCYKALQGVGEDPTLDKVTQEFKNWKGKKYPGHQIANAYKKLKPLLN